jgi:hypothetical protein
MLPAARRRICCIRSTALFNRSEALRDATALGDEVTLRLRIAFI